MFKDNNVEESYPRPISDFGLPPEGIDAAFSWAHNDKTYFFKDNLYWCYDDRERRMDSGYPSGAVLWKGVPGQLDDVTRWSDGEFAAGFGPWEAKLQPGLLCSVGPFSSIAVALECQSLPLPGVKTPSWLQVLFCPYCRWGRLRPA